MISYFIFRLVCSLPNGIALATTSQQQPQQQQQQFIQQNTQQPTRASGDGPQAITPQTIIVTTYQQIAQPFKPFSDVNMPRPKNPEFSAQTARSPSASGIAIKTRPRLQYHVKTAQQVNEPVAQRMIAITMPQQHQQQIAQATGTVNRLANPATIVNSQQQLVQLQQQGFSPRFIPAAKQNKKAHDILNAQRAILNPQRPPVKKSTISKLVSGVRPTAKQQLQELNKRMVAPQQQIRGGVKGPGIIGTFKNSTSNAQFSPSTASDSSTMNSPDSMAGSSPMMNRPVNGGVGQQQQPQPQSQAISPAMTPSSNVSGPNVQTTAENIPGSQISAQLPSAGNLVTGEEYIIQYSNGKKVIGLWDGKYFKIKPPGKLYFSFLSFFYCI